MKNLENRLKEVFSESLGIDLKIISDKLEYNTIDEWDSIGHMSLIAAIEDEFDIMIETDDIIDMSSFKIAKDIVKKYQGNN